MYYEPGATKHGLPWDPFKSCVIPRPIGWISTTDTNGIDNLAPYSQFQNVTFDPPTVMFSANQNTRGERKDTVVNAEARKEFVWNMATYDLRDSVNRSSEELPPEAPDGMGPSSTQPRQIRQGKMGTVDIVFGRVLAVHIADDVLKDGRIDIAGIRPLARLGYYDYTSVDHVFSLAAPENEGLDAGLEGSADKSSRLGLR